MSRWRPFPHDAGSFAYPGKSLHKAWPGLHAGDCEPWPDSARLAAVVDEYPGAVPAGFDGDIAALAGALQEAWRAFHRGDFAAAVAATGPCGLLAHAAANKATGVYAAALEDDPRRQQGLFLAAAERAESAAALLPGDANTHYFHAFNLGRYSQSVSVVAALRQGIGGRIHASLERALALAPDHAEAHTAMGLYHAEIVNKVGRMLGSMTYGASADAAEEHFQRALELTPDAPIAHIEYANGLYLLHGDKRLDEVTELYVRASEMTPRDAMETLDVLAAQDELE